MSGSPVLGFGARLSKLRAMSPVEVAHRLRYAMTLAHERRQYRSGALAPTGRLRAALVPGLRRRRDWREALIVERRRAPAAFLPSVNERDRLRAVFSRDYASELQATAVQAAAARAHRFAFFGGEYQYGTEIPWQTDPVTQADWPAVYHADVPVHGGNAGFGDVKHVWELNRLQFSVDLAKSWFHLESNDDLIALERLTRSWIAGNPYAQGVNWSCALEPAFRVFSWLWAYHLTVEALDDAFHLEWLESFHDHGRFIARHLELYSSPYNHLVAEAAALFMMGACFPQFAEAPRWRDLGRRVLTERLPQQFYADGGSVEQSTFYHHATVGFYLLAGLTGRAAGEDLPGQVWHAIERGLEFSMALMQPDGFTPTIGGADDGKPIRMEHLPLWDFRPYLSIGAVLFGRGDFKRLARRFHEDALWLLGSAGRDAFHQLPPGPEPDASVALPASGYFVVRSDWSATADYVCFDCGEQAAGMRTDAVPNSMHGHADCLSIVVWLGGKRTLVDSGLFAYNCGGAWEAHFRETAAHNTARVDGRDQARHIRKMAWSHSYRATQEGWAPSPGGGWVRGSHDGFSRGPDGVRHRRTVWLHPSRYVAVLDEFDGQGTHDLEVNYQFAPGTLGLAGEGLATFDDDVELAWLGAEPWESTVAHGGPSPAEGWIAPSLGVRVPAPRLTVRCRTSRPHTWLLAVLARRLAPASPRLRIVDEADVRGLVVRAGDGVDVVTTGGGSSLVAHHVPASARIAGQTVSAGPGPFEPQFDERRWRRLAATAFPLEFRV